MVKHIDRKSNEVIFRKCTQPRCNHFRQNPVVSLETCIYLRTKRRSQKSTKNYHCLMMRTSLMQGICQKEKIVILNNRMKSCDTEQQDEDLHVPASEVEASTYFKNV